MHYSTAALSLFTVLAHELGASTAAGLYQVYVDAGLIGRDNGGDSYRYGTLLAITNDLGVAVAS